MIVLNANLLLYAYDAGSVLHKRARAWVENVFSEGEPVGLPWQTVTAFLRVITNPKLRGDRFAVEEAAVWINGWRNRTFDCWGRGNTTGGLSGRLWWMARYEGR